MSTLIGRWPLDAGPDEPSVPRALAIWAAGDGHWMLADFGTAERRFREAAEMFRLLEHEEGAARSLRYLGLTCLSQLDFAGAAAQLRESLAISTRLGHPWEVAFTSFLLGDAVAPGNPDEAHDLYERSLAGFDELSNAMGRGIALTGLGGLALRRGEHEQARLYLLEALELRRATGHAWTEAISLASLAEVALAAGDGDEARRYAAESLEIFERLGDRQRAGWAQGLLATAQARS